jgi:hypothetical protein
MNKFRHLFLCFQTSVYTLGEFHKNRKNSTVFEELTVANIHFALSYLILSQIYFKLIFLIFL